MKSLPVGIVPRSPLVALALALAGLTQTPAIAASGGELDPTFDPVAEEIPNQPEVSADGRGVFLKVTPKTLLRFGDDGRLDTDWHYAAPENDFIRHVVRTASGGLAVTTAFTVRLDFRDGTAASHYVSPTQTAPTPLDDGSLLVFTSPSVIKLDPAGVRDPGYSGNVSLPNAGFSDGTGFSISGTGSASVCGVGDKKGRLVFGGNFLRSGETERIGLVRLLANGDLDQDWNPGPSIGLGQPGSGILDGMPVAVAAGPSNTVVVLSLLKSTNGVRNAHLATIDEQGGVLGEFRGEFSWPVYGPFLCVQPDGKILIPGIVTNVPGQPPTRILRFSRDGSVDPTFNVSLGSTNSSFSLTGMVLDDYGRLVIAGNFESVNGVPRPGLARVLAYDAPPQAPSAHITVSRTRIATNEVLYLTASVDGFPAPDLQWYRDGVPIPGATSRGVRIPVTSGEDVGHFTLVATNSSSSISLAFPEVEFAVRSPNPGSTNRIVTWPTTNLSHINHLVPLPDGKILAACGSVTGIVTNTIPMLFRLLSDGNPDPDFGVGGTVSGNGYAGTLRVLPNGNILVAGEFTQLGGQPASGIAELDPQGLRVPRSFPKIDTDAAVSILPLPDGGYLVTGPFETVGGSPSFRMARLAEDMTVDPSFQSPVAWWQLVDSLELDMDGRVLAVGGSFQAPGVTLTNPVPFGVQRLLPNGSADATFVMPASFSSLAGPRFIAVEPQGDLLIGAPFQRFNAGSQTWEGFRKDSSVSSRTQHASRLSGNTDHTIIRLPDGGGMYPSSATFPTGVQINRWDSSGALDHSFDSFMPYSVVEAMAALPDGSVLMANWNGTPNVVGERRTLAVIPPDPDTRLGAPRLVDGSVIVELATYPGRNYEIRRLTDLSSGESTLVAEVEGDGYVQEFSTPSDSGVLFVTVQRKP